MGVRASGAGRGELLALLAAAIGGVAIAAYLTTVHYSAVPLACSVSGVFNCAQVTQSSFSVVPGTSVPITVPGMAWFAVSGALAAVGLRSARRSRPEPRGLRALHLAWALGGLAVVLYLVHAEIAVIHRVCEWCTGVHLLILATALLALRRLQTAVG